MSAAPRGLSRPHASFIGTVCQGIHHCALHNDQPTSPKAHRRRPPRTHNEKHNNLCPTGTLDYQIITHINHTPTRAWPTRNKRTNTHTRQPKDGCIQAAPPTTTMDDAPRFIHSTNTNHTPTTREAWPLLASTLQFSNHHHTTSPARRHKHHARPMGAEHPPPEGAWRSGDPTACTAPRPPTPQAAGQTFDLFHTSKDDPPPHTGRANRSPHNTDATQAPRKNSVERR